eukprot:CAMPEP_0197658262 /NCGR_PEP_ID=MMETSP1338-20131121/45133_1 /TAXON_ID=43686 ORGANISM="Pelagodinium beii, Strain RCC1491" /NCGR_SAMPLE_ID=MMETSP1338 /ASSEMBLY_ACC=CAM_ASM_000754 /LENGTH=420 /DNA_ID=CAMNT_0043234819 /DNA_START=44 /DNA_END=1306 /DNA_ORIENTATION=+
MATGAAVSRVVLYERTARWNIENAQCLSLKPNTMYESDTLFDIPEGHRFSLQVFMGGHGAELENTSTQVGLFAHCTGYESCLQPLMWRPQLVCINQADATKNRMVLSSREQDAKELCRQSNQWSTIGSPDFIERAKLATDGFMVNGTLVFELRVKAWFPVLLSSRMPAKATSEPSCAALAFSDDMARLLKSGAGSDVSLRAGIQNDATTSAGPLRAHRSLLAARSPVFHRMFYGSTGMAETAACAEVCLSDMDHPTASLFLEFLYTGKVDATAWEDEDALCHLLLAGHKYEVGSLVKVCVSHIASTLSEENAAERLMMADLLGISQIQDAALEYICASSKRLSAIQSTKAFERLGQQRPQLALKIMAKMVAPAKRSAESNSLPEDLSSQTVVKLKQLCSDRGLPTSGSKQVLIERLQASV